jgi:hypothetical protein
MYNNGKEDVEMSSHSYSYLIFDKVAKNMFSQQMMLGKLDIHMQKTENICLARYTKINSK